MTHPFARTLRAGIAALALSATGAMADDALDLSAMSEEQRAAFGAQVRAYLLENPQVIMEAVAILEQREQQQQAQSDVALVQAHADQLFNDGYSWVGGNPDGDVTIVEFLDYRCGYCRKAHPEVEELIASDGNIRLIVKEFPILGEASVVASRFAIATQIVAGDDAYKAIHDALVVMDGQPGEAVLTRLANTLGLDADAILAEMNSDTVTDRIRQTRALAQAMQISGTPTFVFGDQMLRGYAPLDAMRGILEEVRNNG